jgi:hypothetical protein
VAGQIQRHRLELIGKGLDLRRPLGAAEARPVEEHDERATSERPIRIAAGSARSHRCQFGPGTSFRSTA